MSETKKRKIYVKEFGTDKIVHTVETDKTGAALDKVVAGMLRNTDLDKYYIDDAEAQEAT